MKKNYIFKIIILALCLSVLDYFCDNSIHISAGTPAIQNIISNCFFFIEKSMIGILLLLFSRSVCLKMNLDFKKTVLISLSFIMFMIIFSWGKIIIGYYMTRTPLSDSFMRSNLLPAMTIRIYQWIFPFNKIYTYHCYYVLHISMFLFYISPFYYYLKSQKRSPEND